MTPTNEQDKRVLELHARTCRTLADPKHLEILNLPRQGELSAGKLAERMGASLSNVSQHLAKMRDRGVVMTRREGVSVYYRVADPRIIQACNLMRDVLFEQLARSGQLVEIVQQG